MRALSLALAMLLVQGCAPTALGTTTSTLISSGDTRSTADVCDLHESCDGGGSGSVAIPVLIIIAALTVPAFLHHWVFRSDPKPPSATGRQSAPTANE
jgi:hypothetical protein